MSKSMNHYTFGAIQMGKSGMACYYPTEKLTPKVQALTIEQAREAYKNAKTQFKSATETMKRYSNVSVHGWSIYERASQQAYMAELVMLALCKHFSENA